MDNRVTMNKHSWVFRILIIGCVVILHIGCYHAVNLLTGQRPEHVLLSFNTVVDDWVPYMGWTWTFYSFGDFYILVIGILIVWRLPGKKFVRAVYAYIGMIITGALIQLALPSKSPWPDELNSAQEFFHNLFTEHPYACLPSMHVALVVLPACILFSVTKAKWIRILSTVIVVFITISTVTLKEHYFVDAISGVLFAFLFYSLWRWDFQIIKKKKER